jgi:hypothetical protein
MKEITYKILNCACENCCHSILFQIRSVADLYPGSGVFMTREPVWKKSGSGIRVEHPGSYFREI